MPDLRDQVELLLDQFRHRVGAANLGALAVPCGPALHPGLLLPRQTLDDGLLHLDQFAPGVQVHAEGEQPRGVDAVGCRTGGPAAQQHGHLQRILDGGGARGGRGFLHRFRGCHGTRCDSRGSRYSRLLRRRGHEGHFVHGRLVK
ncbi:hypothetical protein [Paraburkholderia terrae]|uniref:hypothetical protein n=1 Tax=Paraburkholderia terrae TaxID=311230 RepID=UPI0033658CA0